MNCTFRIVEAEPCEVVREREHRTLDGEIMVARVYLLGRGGEQEAGDDDVDGLREDLLSHAESRLGVELALIEVDRLVELEELLGLPTKPVELGDLRARELCATQRGEEEGLLAVWIRQLDRTKLDGLGASSRVLGGRNDDTVVVTTARAEVIDRLERMRRRESDEEVDAVIEQDAQDLVRRVSAIQHQDVAFSQHFEVIEQQFALAGTVSVDHHIARDLGHHVDERAHRRLWDVTAFRPAEAGIEFWAPLQVELAAVDREHSTIIPARGASERGFHLARGSVQDVSQQLARQLAARLAERRRRNGLLRRQRHAVRGALVPERIQEVPVALSIAVACHEQQQHHEQVGGQLVTTTEVAWAAPKARITRIGEDRRDQVEDLTGRAMVGTNFQRPACQSA